MSGEIGKRMVRFGNLLACGAALLAIVFYTPNIGSVRGASFLQIALSAQWSQWFDWVAAWCSLKIILFNMGVLALCLAFGVLLDLLDRERRSERLLAVVLLPILGTWVGGYYLLKALL